MAPPGRPIALAVAAVLEAGDGVQGVDLARNHHGPIPLVVTDIQMPGLDGIEMARQITRVRPETRVLCISSVVDPASIRRQAGSMPLVFLEKPFDGPTLLEKVRETLHA